MQSRFEHNGLVWIDLESPTRAEVIDVASRYNLDPMIAEELLIPSTKPRAEFRDGYAYAVLHFPALRHSHKTREQEVDFVIGADFLITTHYDSIDPLHKFSKVFEVNALLENQMDEHAGFIFFHMLKRLYKSVEHEIEYLKKDLNRIEEHIYSAEHVAMVEAISRDARDLINIRQTIEPHREVLRDLEEGGVKFFGESFMPYLKALANDYYRVHNHVTRNIEFLHELRETNNSLLTTRQNETMKIFTILAFFTFPLSLVTELFNLAAQHGVLSGSTAEFWFVLMIEAVIAVSMFTYFRRKKWL